MDFEGSTEIRQALQLVGERLAAERQEFRLVLIGGAALNLKGLIARATADVDIIAVGSDGGAGAALSPTPVPLPEPLYTIGREVARDLRLDPEWLDPRPGDLWRLGLPPGLVSRITWERFGGLWVGLTDRVDLIPLKLYAAAHEAWSGPGRHLRDLRTLRPAPTELRRARAWVETQDPSPGFLTLLEQVLQELSHDTE